MDTDILNKLRYGSIWELLMISAAIYVILCDFFIKNIPFSDSYLFFILK